MSKIDKVVSFFFLNIIFFPDKFTDAVAEYDSVSKLDRVCNPFSLGLV